MQCRIWHYSFPVLSTTWIWPYILPVLFLLSSTNKVPVNVTRRTKHFTKKYSLGGVGLGWRQKMTALLRCLRVSAADWSCLFVALTIDGHVLDDAKYIHTILNKHSWHSFNIYRYYQLWKDQHPTPSRTAIATPQQQNLNTDEAERFCDVADKWNEYQQHVEWVGCKHWGANESYLWVLMRATYECLWELTSAEVQRVHHLAHLYAHIREHIRNISCAWRSWKIYVNTAKHMHTDTIGHLAPLYMCTQHTDIKHVRMCKQHSQKDSLTGRIHTSIVECSSA